MVHGISGKLVEVHVGSAEWDDHAVAEWIIFLVPTTAPLTSEHRQDDKLFREERFKGRARVA